jgi:hypothetical protein
VLETAVEEDRTPPPAIVAPELEIVLVASHPGGDATDPAPGVETVVQKSELGLACVDSEEAEGRSEKIAPIIDHGAEASM